MKGMKKRTQKTKKKQGHKMQTRKYLVLFTPKKKADNTDIKQCNFIV